MTRIRIRPGLEAADYERHVLHGDGMVWVEKNCYIDVFIELLHALGLEPLAMLGATAEIDFEGDNVTFFKPWHNELRALYGVDVNELNVWRPLLDHAVEHLGAGRFLSTEADSYNLPDTDGTDYHRNHVKTTIILADLDADSRRAGYFHNAAYHELGGEDFDRLFRRDAAATVALPLFAETVRVDRLVQHAPGELARLARELLAFHVSRRPRTNPMEQFRRRFERELPDLQSRGLNHYHAWAFAIVRQTGASLELLAWHLRWLAVQLGEGPLEVAAAGFERSSRAAKTFILKAARAVNTGRPLDAATLFDEMAAGWDDGMTVAAQHLGEPATQPA